MDRMSDDISYANPYSFEEYAVDHKPDIQSMTTDGVLVIVLSDGAYNGYMGYDSGLWFTDDPDDNSLGFLLSENTRKSASAVAAAIMEKARSHELHDNTTVAVARMQ